MALIRIPADGRDRYQRSLTKGVRIAMLVAVPNTSECRLRRVHDLAR